MLFSIPFELTCMTYVISLKYFQNLPEAQNIFHCMEMRLLVGEKSANVNKIITKVNLNFYLQIFFLKE